MVEPNRWAGKETPVVGNFRSEMEIVSIVVLLEKNRLRSSVFGFVKVAQTNANEPIALLRTKINPLSQLQGDVSQLFAGGE